MYYVSGLRSKSMAPQQNNHINQKPVSRRAAPEDNDETVIHPQKNQNENDNKKTGTLGVFFVIIGA